MRKLETNDWIVLNNIIYKIHFPGGGGEIRAWNTDFISIYAA